MKKTRHLRELSKVALAPASTPLSEIGDRTPLSYKQRNELIRVELGFNSYREYLESPLWAGIRRRAIVRYGTFGNGDRGQRRCWTCLVILRADYPADTTITAQVHHIVFTRDNLKGKTVNNLRLVCDLCRGAAEFDGSRKLTAEESRQRTIELANDPTWPSRARKIRQALGGGSVKPARAGSQSKGFEERRRQLAAGVKKNRKRARKGEHK